MKYISVCSGIEAASVAWEPLGFTPVSFAEIEKFPSAVLAHHWPHVENIGNMEKLLENEHRAPVDILVGGTPCQSFSVAGLRGGLNDPRGNLMLTYGAIADALKPRWIVWENVPGVLSSNGGRDFGTFLGMLAKLGYGFAYRVLDAQNFGVPQRRRRVFVVGCFGDWKRAAAVLFESESLQGDTKKGRKKRKGITRKATTGIRGSCFRMTAFGEYQNDNTSSTLKQLDYKDATDLICFEPRSPDGHARTHGDICPTLNTMGGGQREPCVCTPINTQMALRGPNTSNSSREGVGIGKPEDPSFTLQAAHSHAVQTGMDVRRLTPVECERLQGFPDNHTRIPWRGKGPKDCPYGPRYKAIGNSMAVPVMRWIGERIQGAI